MVPRLVQHRARTRARVRLSEALPAAMVVLGHDGARLEGVLEDGCVVTMTHDLLDVTQWIPLSEIDEEDKIFRISDNTFEDLLDWVTRSPNTKRKVNEFANKFQRIVAAEFGIKDLELCQLNRKVLVQATELYLGWDVALDYKEAERRAAQAVLAHYRGKFELEDFDIAKFKVAESDIAESLIPTVTGIDSKVVALADWLETEIEAQSSENVDLVRRPQLDYDCDTFKYDETKDFISVGRDTTGYTKWEL